MASLEQDRRNLDSSGLLYYISQKDLFLPKSFYEKKGALSLGTVFEARLCIPSSFVHAAKKDLATVCGEQVGHRGQQANGQPYSILEGIITDPSLIGQAKQLQEEWNARLEGQGDHLGFSLLELLQLYLYRTYVQRGQNIY